MSITNHYEYEEALVRERGELRAEIERLRAALKPFADYAIAYGKAYPGMDHSDNDIGWIASFGRITFGHLRAACNALIPATPPGKGSQVQLPL